MLYLVFSLEVCNVLWLSSNKKMIVFFAIFHSSVIDGNACSVNVVRYVILGHREIFSHCSV